MFVSDDFMPAALAERLHRFLGGLAPSVWTVWHGRDPDYRFRHLPAPHLAWCECAVCAARAVLHSEDARAHLAAVLGVPSLLVGPSNVTWYMDGDFLAPHTDEPNGDVAFVWSLTKDWHERFGGNLHLQGTVQVPTFNRFVLFSVAEGCAPHHVSMVSASPGLRRIAISGWYRIGLVRP